MTIRAIPDDEYRKKRASVNPKYVFRPAGALSFSENPDAPMGWLKSIQRKGPRVVITYEIEVDPVKIVVFSSKLLFNTDKEGAA